MRVLASNPTLVPSSGSSSSSPSPSVFRWSTKPVSDMRGRISDARANSSLTFLPSRWVVRRNPAEIGIGTRPACATQSNSTRCALLSIGLISVLV
jgi:hypothetical protein